MLMVLVNRGPNNQGLTVISFFQASFQAGLFPFAYHDFSVLMCYENKLYFFLVTMFNNQFDLWCVK